ncbi:hypothetical protein IAG44_27850 [Streptomyces roseirectus]|uniref:Ankyrin n=1 Tax=Streptomyces roseirectus TaxID=2768066 RepID=A0A7H0IJA4_9ACTN|nr:hypothetical protein [Streptomyces roseirectus]QNP72870.1 hypothetical protein IAG44_27850 [Streptomyces roseirectus]
MSESLYEIHVTVDDPDVARLRAWASGAGLKLTVIELARGRMPVQPMLTLDAGSYDAARARAREVTAGLRAAGFAPVRVKVESAPWAPEVPDGPCGDGRYFEHHVKLRVDGDAGLGELAALVAPFGAHLSRNARREGERFVTQRCRGVDAAGARAALEKLLRALEGWPVLSVEREFVLDDSDESVDEGWIA